MAELNAIGKGRIDHSLEHFLHSLNNILAVLTSIDDPADGLLKLLCPLGLIETLLTINSEHLLYHPQDIDQETSFGKGACPSDTVLDAVEENQSRVIHLQLSNLVLLQVFEKSVTESLLLTFDVGSQVSFEGIGDGS